jgi:uncharacterized RDD family membrane protein YckC
MYASNGQRFANYIIDTIVLYILMMIVLVILMITLGDAVIDPISGEPTLLATYGTLFLVGMGYYTFFEAQFSKTIGKFITKTMVVTSDGRKVSTNHCAHRSICRFIPFDALSFLGSSGSGWHDRISDTAVVKVAEYENALEIQSSFNEIGQAEDRV